MSARAYVCACVRACVPAFALACVRACMHACLCVRLLFGFLLFLYIFLPVIFSSCFRFCFVLVDRLNVKRGPEYILSYQKVPSFADETGGSVKKHSGVVLGGHNSEDVPEAPVWGTARQKTLSPRVHRHHHLRQVIRTSGRFGRNRNLPVSADHADWLVGSHVGASKVGIVFDL